MLLQPNDQIISIAEGDDKPIELAGTKDVAKVVGMIRGSIRTVVRLAIVPVGKDDTNEVVVSLIRGDIKQIDGFVDGRLLPAGSKPPNFKFTRLNDSKEMQLSEFTRRVVVLEFWASWCGPCLKANENLDSLASQHPEWKDQVELLAVSVDDKEAEAVASANNHRWSSVTIGWAGPEILKLYRVSGLPTTFIIDRNGLAAAVGNRLDIPTAMNRFSARHRRNKPSLARPSRVDCCTSSAPGWHAICITSNPPQKGPSNTPYSPFRRSNWP